MTDLFGDFGKASGNRKDTFVRKALSVERGAN